jgi:hypothetical protein
MVSPLSVCMSSRLLQCGHVDIFNGRPSCLLGVVGRELKTQQAYAAASVFKVSTMTLETDDAGPRAISR